MPRGEMLSFRMAMLSGGNPTLIFLIMSGSFTSYVVRLFRVSFILMGRTI